LQVAGRVTKKTLQGGQTSGLIGTGIATGNTLAIAAQAKLAPSILKSTLQFGVKHSNAVVAVGFFSVAAFQTVREWRKNPQRKPSDLFKQIGVLTTTHGVGFGGSMLGTAIGTAFLGPVGAVIGGIVGGIGGSWLGNTVSTTVVDYVTTEAEHAANRKMCAHLLGISVADATSKNTLLRRWHYVRRFTHPDKVAPQYREDAHQMHILLERAFEYLIQNTSGSTPKKAVPQFYLTNGT